MRGPVGDVVPAFTQEVGAEGIFWNRRYGGPEREVDTAIKEWAAGADVQVESFQASLLQEPWTGAHGADTEAVLSELGYSPDELAALYDDGSIG